MATYTDLSRSDLEAFLQHYNIGKLLDFRPVSGGVQNSTYALTAQTAEKASIQGYFLSILEDIDQAQVEFTLGLCRYLSQAGLPVATSIKSNDSTLYHRIFDKPAALYPKIPGTHPDSPNVACCEQIASFLGKMHKTGVNFGETLPNRFDRAWLRSTIAALLPTATREELALLTRLDETAQKLAADMPKELPIGAIHCDLFVDNTLFLGDRLSGVIDFYQACTDYYALDLAILINDWCFDSDNRLDEMRVESILQRYHSERALTSTETQLLEDFLVLAAGMFWASRLRDYRLRNLQHPDKPPEQYQQRLSWHLHHPQTILRILERLSG